MPNKSLTVMSLNVGRLLKPRTRTHLEQLVAGEEPAPDVLCLQDIPKRDLPWLCGRWPFVSYKSMTNHLIYGVRAEVGVAMLSRYPMDDETFCFTWGDGVLKDLQGVNDKNERIAPTAENDRLIESTEDRVAILATVVKEGKQFNIATTHGFWVRDGVVNDRQRESTRKLLEFLQSEGGRRKGLLLASDLNFGRYGEIYKMLVGNRAGIFVQDCIPTKIDNTLDPGHPFVKKGGKVVTDWFLAVNRASIDFAFYDVENVRLVSGVSDHCALLGAVTIEFEDLT